MTSRARVVAYLSKWPPLCLAFVREMTLPHRCQHLCSTVSIDKYRCGTSCDAILCAANGTDFHVHRVVVMGKAEYFEAIYGGNWGGAHGAVTLSQIPADALAAASNGFTLDRPRSRVTRRFSLSWRRPCTCASTTS